MIGWPARVLDTRTTTATQLFALQAKAVPVRIISYVIILHVYKYIIRLCVIRDKAVRMYESFVLTLYVQYVIRLSRVFSIGTPVLHIRSIYVHVLYEKYYLKCLWVLYIILRSI